MLQFNDASGRGGDPYSELSEIYDYTLNPNDDESIYLCGYSLSQPLFSSILTTNAVIAKVK